MKQYLLSVHHTADEVMPSEPEMQEMFQAVEAVNEQIRQAGAWVFAGGLYPPETATVVRSQDGELLTTDGPFAETKEQIGGFWVIKVDDLDAALDWAGKATVTCRAPIEVRPFQDEPA